MIHRLLLGLFLGACVLTAAQAAPERTPLKLYDGREFKRATIVAIEGDKVTIAHVMGVEVVPTDQVPLDVLAIAFDELAKRRTEQRTLEEVTRLESARRRTEAPDSPNRDSWKDTRPSRRTTLRPTGDIIRLTAPENACVVAINSGGSGTGFVLRQEDGFVLVTNQHVIDAKPPHKFVMPGGKALRPHSGFLATDRDIAVFDLEESFFDNYFEMEPSIDAVPLGEKLVIYGNSKGEGLRISHATLLAKSSIQIEVSGGMVHGNSGGPIVRSSTGRVIGVSTFVRARGSPRTFSDLVSDAALPKLQFYGMRIDTLTKSNAFQFSRFVEDSERLERADDRLKEGISVLALLFVNNGFMRSSEISALAAKADDSARGTFALRANRNAFARRLDEILAPIGPGTSFIHTRKRDELAATRNLLAEAFAELVPGYRPPFGG